MRLDKWLWCARFYKTRSLAAEAVRGGKVHLNTERTKPAKSVAVGDRVSITRGPYRYRIEVQALPLRRGPANEARTLYLETDESRQAREAEQVRRHVERVSTPQSPKKPTKKDRRQLRRWRGY